jgi:hypothetical protein
MLGSGQVSCSEFHTEDPQIVCNCTEFSHHGNQVLFDLCNPALRSGVSKIQYVRFESVTVVTKKITVFSDVA